MERLPEPTSGDLVARAAHGLAFGILTQTGFRPGEGMAGWVIARQRFPDTLWQ